MENKPTTYRVKSLTLGGKGNKIFNGGDIVVEGNFPVGAIPTLIAKNFLEVYEEGTVGATAAAIDEGFHKNDFYNKEGFNADGFDKNGFDKDGFNKDGLNVGGFDRDGFDKNGFDEKGYNKEGFNVSGYNADGFDANGFNSAGYDKDGFNKDGYDTTGFNKDGFDQEGFGRDGFNKEGANRAGEKTSATASDSSDKENVTGSNAVDTGTTPTDTTTVKIPSIDEVDAKDIKADLKAAKVSTEGEMISSKVAHVSVSEKLLTDAGYPVRNAKGHVDLNGHKVNVKDSTGIVNNYILSNGGWYPDEMLGHIVCILEFFEP